MTHSGKTAAAADPLAFLAGGGEMGERVRAFDWSANPLAPPASWPQGLQAAVSICLNSRFPIVLWWGPELRLLYNDAWRPVLGRTKHPQALGSPGREVWPEIWHIIGPMLEGVLAQGKATWSDDQLLPLDRNGYLEEAYFTYSYSPILGDGGKVGGVFAAVNETTQRVIGERRLKTLRGLAAQAAMAKVPDEAGRSAVATLAANPMDVPFALLYLLAGDQKQARLCEGTGLPPDHPARPTVIPLADDGSNPVWPLASVVQSGRKVVGLDSRHGPLPMASWPVAPQQGVLFPLMSSGQDRAVGVLVLGVNPSRELDDEHRGFHDLVAGHVATAIANALAYDEERRRAEALADLDRAKTAFFSNVSHEFRTPLTLMLGPVEDSLALPGDGTVAVSRETLEVVHRNGRRLQKLVNTLLDFSRIEAGRVQASFEPTDLAAVTAELASNFRSACEKAGLELRVDCPPLSGPVYVDQEMWEKVVLNLLSNAFKFTLRGRIEVALRQAGPVVELTVRDTGTGIPTDHMPHLFERFHRVEGAKGRTQEGSGIGLALVRELARLHGGDVRAESEPDRGTTFTVSIPVGTAHLPPDRIRASRTLASTALVASTYVEEALRWLPDTPERPDQARPDVGDVADVTRPVANGERPRILLADDNADMRDYIRRLLAGQYDVTAVADGLAARDAARRKTPDLVLTDVMMPGLDGFGLLRELRADPKTQALPVILLSARAGEEARVEGLQAGADDYLTKPFSAKELLARIASALEIARLRREALDRERHLLAEAEEQRNWLQVTLSSIGDAVIATDEAGRVMFLNPVAEALTGWSQAEAQGAELEAVFRIVNEQSRRPVENPVTKVLREGVVVGLANHTVLIARDDTETPIDDSAAPIRDEAGPLQGVVLVFRDISAKRRAEEEVRRAGEQARTILESITDAFCALDRDWRFTYVNRQAEALMGRTRDDLLGKNHWEEYPDTLGTDVERNFRRAVGEGVTAKFEHFYPPHDRWYETRAYPSPEGLSVYFRDVSERKRAEIALRESEQRLTAELEAMTRLHALSTRLLTTVDLGTALDDVLQEAIRVCGADYGNVQLYNPQSRALQIVAQRGFRDDFLAHFRSVRVDEGSACAQAMASGERIIIEDVELDPSYEPHRRIAATAGYRAVQSTPLKSRNGHVIGMLSTHFPLPHRPSERDQRLLDLYARHAADLIERLRFEEALRRSEAQFRQLADAMPQIVWTARPDGNIDYLNHRWTEFAGLPQTVGNEGWGSILHPDDARPAGERWAASLDRGAPFEMEVRLLDRRQQTYRWHLIRTVAVHDEAGRVARWFGTATDIDRQKRAEESSRYLAEASAALASVVDYESTLQKVVNLAVPYFADWSAVDVTNDDGGLRRLAVAHQDAKKVHLAHELMRDYPPDPTAPGGAVAVLRTGKPQIVSEITDDMLVQGARDERHLRLVRSLGLKSYICVPLVVSGNSLGVLTFATAESGRRYTEADLALATDLAHRASVAIENTQLYQALRETDRRKDEFLATLAHELRNPLAPIRNSLQILKMPRVDAQTVERSREMMDRQVHHLVRLVDDLLDVSRVMRGKIELRRERVELATVVARAVETVQPLLDAQGHELSVRLPPKSLPLDADPVRLAQVVGNLLTNAAKYTEPGGRIWLTAQRDGEMTVLRVRDNGIGIDPAMLPRIFELFVQVDHASTKAQGGLGIDLTLVKNLVEMHNGTVEARSAGLGRGSEFIVRLPISALGLDQNRDRQAGQQVYEPPSPSGHRLLVVDDNQDAANSLAMLLKLQGHEVRVAYSGVAAMEMTKSYTPDVVFLDIGMPGMDGYEVARRLRQQPGLERVVLAALTGWGQQEDRRRTAEAGFNHHLVKPPESAAVEAVLAAVPAQN